jgi:hypothetical protein
MVPVDRHRSPNFSWYNIRIWADRVRHARSRRRMVEGARALVARDRVECRGFSPAIRRHLGVRENNWHPRIALVVEPMVGFLVRTLESLGRVAERRHPLPAVPAPPTINLTDRR